MPVGRLFGVLFPLFVVSCSLLFPFDEYDSQYGLADSGGADPQAPDSSAPGCTGANLDTDSRHCGACGHDCKGARCQGGMCEAELVVSNPSLAIEGLAQDEVWLYGAGTIVDGTGIARFKKANMTEVHPVAYASSPAHFLAVRGTDIYWTEDRGVGHIVKPADNAADPSKGTKTDPFFLAINPPDGAAVDDNFVYWTQAELGFIKRARRDTTAPATLADNALSARSIASDGEFVFWTERFHQTLMRARTDGSDVKAIVVAQPEPAGLWVDDSSVYFTSRTAPGTVKRVDKDGSNPVVIAAGEPNLPDRAFVDGDYVYWIEVANQQANGAVRRARRDGSEAERPLTLAAGQTPVDLVVDRTHVYWSSTAEHAIRRVAK